MVGNQIAYSALLVQCGLQCKVWAHITRYGMPVHALRYREIKIQADRQTITAADPLPDDLRQALDAINRPD